jgi:phage anti-repressor protein/phage antirepressor YoqD-like protein
MNDLITITKQTINNEEISSVSARELYIYLGLDISHWKRWYNKNISSNDFAVEGQDYQGFVIMTNGNETKDFSLTLDFAKRLAMMTRTEKGEKARNYFIECEKQLKEQNKRLLPATYKAALIELVHQIELNEHLETVNNQLASKIEKDAPLVSFGTDIATSSDNILIGDLAKVSGKIGRNNLFKKLKENRILCRDNLPRQQYIDSGYFEVTERVVKSVKGDLNTFTTYVTGKGQIWLLAKIDEFLLDN